MLAHDPAELPLVFARHLNAGDLDGLLSDYYATEVAYAPLPGTVVRRDGLRTALAALLQVGRPIEVDVRHVLRAGDVALVVLDWEIASAGLRGTATDVARRQGDGTWRCVVDNPHGTARAGDLREAASALAPGR